jgi:hypothetical protein
MEQSPKCKSQSIKLLEEYTGINLYNLKFLHRFLDMILIAQSNKKKKYVG